MHQTQWYYCLTRSASWTAVFCFPEENVGRSAEFTDVFSVQWKIRTCLYLSQVQNNRPEPFLYTLYGQFFSPPDYPTY